MVENIFDPEHYRNVRLPLAAAHTLPSHCYTAQEFYQRELATAFAPAWHFAGRVDTLATRGDTRVIDTPHGSTLLTRVDDRTIKAHVNACRHRGTRLINDDGPCRNFVCPYHSWAYALDGSLRAAPGMDGIDNFDPEDFALEPRRLQIWGGFMFVQHDQTTSDFSDWIGNLQDYVGNHDAASMQTVFETSFDIDANWKFLVENAIEAYHTGTVHRDTLGAQDSASINASGNWDALYVPSEPDKTLATLPGEAQAMPFIDALEGAAASGTYFTMIYPSTQIVFAQDCIWWLDFKPLAVDRTRLNLGACFPETTVALADFEQRLAPYVQRWRRATPEDNAIAQAQQRGHASAAIPPGRFALTEHCVHRFNNWLLDTVL